MFPVVKSKDVAPHGVVMELNWHFTPVWSIFLHGGLSVFMIVIMQMYIREIGWIVKLVSVLNFSKLCHLLLE